MLRRVTSIDRPDSTGPFHRAACAHPIDPSLHGVCEVCGGMRLCLDCARAHLCTSECAARGCQAGLCVKEVRNGVVASEFGID